MMTLICLGDSLTYGYGVPRPRAWPALLAKAAGLDVRNCGINGDTTGGMLARFQAEAAAVQAHAVCIMGGFNDLALGVELGAIKANLFALVQHCCAARAKPVLGIPIPVRRPVTFPLLTSLDVEKACAGYEHLRLWLYSLAADFSLPRVDFYGRFAEVALGAGHAAVSAFYPGSGSGPVPSLDALYLDGLHPSEAGHALMAQEAARVLARGAHGG